MQEQMYCVVVGAAAAAINGLAFSASNDWIDSTAGFCWCSPPKAGLLATICWWLLVCDWLPPVIPPWKSPAAASAAACDPWLPADDLI